MNDPELKIDPAEYPPVPADPEIIPDSTYWPIVLAFGIAFFLWGYLITLFVSGLGLVCIFLALVGWIKELNKEK